MIENLGRVVLDRVPAVALPRCKDCRWWDQEWTDGAGAHPCERLAHTSPYYDGDPCIETSQPSVAAHLMTPPNFGCVLWEAKP